MSWLRRLLSRPGEAVQPQRAPAPAEAQEGVQTKAPAGASNFGELPAAGFAIVDLETTGLSPRQDRVVSIAVVLVNEFGRFQDEWETLVHPQRPMAATHIHGIRDVDVAGAPSFETLVPHLIGLLAGRVIVGHNLKFDEAFLRYEFGRAGWGWPEPSVRLCTLQESYHFLPHLDRRRLPDCCWASGIRLQDAHSALGDARATAALLASYLDPGFGVGPTSAHRAVLGAATRVLWPTEPGIGRVAHPNAEFSALPSRARRVIRVSGERPVRVPTLLESFTLSDALDDGAPEGALSYLELLVAALEDGQITDEEASALADVVDVYGLSDLDVAAGHRGLVRALARQALEDGVLARAERAELSQVAGLLAVSGEDVKELLDGQEEQRLAKLSLGLAPLPPEWVHGEPLRVGERVAFTGCQEAEREGLEARAKGVGVRVMNSVSRRTAMLVTDGSFAGTKAEAAAALGTRTVTPGEFRYLLDHLQPWSGAEDARAEVRRVIDLRLSGPEDTTGAVAPSRQPQVDAADRNGSPSPADVRVWARENGYEVGVRGRLAAELWDAYAAAH